MNKINWTYPMLLRLQKAYVQARADKVDTFKFEGHEYLVEYAKYLIEYLNHQLKKS